MNSTPSGGKADIAEKLHRIAADARRKKHVSAVAYLVGRRASTLRGQWLSMRLSALRLPLYLLGAVSCVVVQSSGADCVARMSPLIRHRA